MKFRPIPFIRYFARWFVLLLGCSILLVGIWFTIGLSPEERCFETWAMAIFCFIYTIFVFPYILHQVWEKYFATLFVSESQIIWRCPFRRTKYLLTEQCYIGVEKEISHWKIEYNYIYFSLSPYPRKFTNKIDKLPNSDTFLKYRFEPKLAEYILRTLPKAQTKPLDYFYYLYLREHKKDRRKPQKR